MAHQNHNLCSHLVQMGNFCIAEFLLRGQVGPPGWLWVHEASQNQGGRYLKGTGSLTDVHRQKVPPKVYAKNLWALPALLVGWA